MKRPVVVTVGVLLGVGALALALWWLLMREEATLAPAPSNEPSTSPTVTVSVTPTETEEPTPTPSDTTAEPDPQPTQAAPDLAARSNIPGASAILTLASWDANTRTVLVGGFISGVIEDGGKCRFIVTAADTGAERSVESVGAFNVDSTTCGSHDVELPSSQNGQIQVRLVYSNNTGTAMSEVITVETK